MADDLAHAPELIRHQWNSEPCFTEHSYRSFSADGPGREFILFQNIDYTHAEWTFRDRTGQWFNGKLPWPDGKDYPKSQPIRVCYPNVMLKNRAVYFCGVSDIVEPYPEWRVFKRQLTGQQWDYDFRRLFFASFQEEFNIEMDEEKSLEVQTVSEAVDFISTYIT